MFVERNTSITNQHPTKWLQILYNCGILTFVSCLFNKWWLMFGFLKYIRLLPRLISNPHGRQQSLSLGINTVDNDMPCYPQDNIVGSHLSDECTKSILPNVCRKSRSFLLLLLQVCWQMRSEGSEGTMSCPRALGKETTHNVTVTSWMTCAQQSFHGSMQTAIKNEVSSGLTSARSDCAVSGVVMRFVLCALTPYRNQRIELRLCRERIKHHQKETWLERHFRATDHNNILTVWRHVGCELTFVSGLDHCTALTLALRSCPQVMLPVPLRVTFSRSGFNSNHRLVSYGVRSQQTSSMFFPQQTIKCLVYHFVPSTSISRQFVTILLIILQLIQVPVSWNGDHPSMDLKPCRAGPLFCLPVRSISQNIFEHVLPCHRTTQKSLREVFPTLVTFQLLQQKYVIQTSLNSTIIISLGLHLRWAHPKHPCSKNYVGSSRSTFFINFFQKAILM